MYERRFSKWRRWENRNDDERIKQPGVYIIAISTGDIAGKKFSWLREIVYVGMTNAGLKGRLRKFDDTIQGKSGHGGAHRVRHKHPNYEKLERKLFVSVSPFKCDIKSDKPEPEDLRIMGKVAKFEYDCIACFVELFGCLPEFNDRHKSPKR